MRHRASPGRRGIRAAQGQCACLHGGAHDGHGPVDPDQLLDLTGSVADPQLKGQTPGCPPGQPRQLPAEQPVLVMQP
jgi:hypothetical protein